MECNLLRFEVFDWQAESFFKWKDSRKKLILVKRSKVTEKVHQITLTSSIVIVKFSFNVQYRNLKLFIYFSIRRKKKETAERQFYSEFAKNS